MENLTDPSGSYDARLLIGTRSIIGVEAAYIGTAGNIDTLGLDNDALLVSNGAEGLLRLNIGTYMIQPFIFGGAAWQRFDLVNEGVNTSSVSGSDDVFALPFGAGVSSYLGSTGLTLDVRATYRATYSEDLLNTDLANDDDGGDLDTWNISGRLGYEF
jgi:hypothetical protein